MLENTDQKNSEYGHFLLIEILYCFLDKTWKALIY